MLYLNGLVQLIRTQLTNAMVPRASGPRSSILLYYYVPRAGALGLVARTLAPHHPPPGPTHPTKIKESVPGACQGQKWPKMSLIFDPFYFASPVEIRQTRVQKWVNFLLLMPSSFWPHFEPQIQKITKIAKNGQNRQNRLKSTISDPARPARDTCPQVIMSLKLWFLGILALFWTHFLTSFWPSEGLKSPKIIKIGQKSSKSAKIMIFGLNLEIFY